MEVKVFTVKNGRKENYGEPILITKEDFRLGYEDVLYRVAGGAVLAGDENVGVEILGKEIIGRDKIKDELWWKLWAVFDR